MLFWSALVWSGMLMVGVGVEIGIDVEIESSWGRGGEGRGGEGRGEERPVSSNSCVCFCTYPCTS